MEVSGHVPLKGVWNCAKGGSKEAECHPEALTNRNFILLKSTHRDLGGRRNTKGGSNSAERRSRSAARPRGRRDREEWPVGGAM
jgi:hypothetical protein